MTKGKRGTRKLVAQFDAADSAPTVRAEGFAAQT